MDLVNIIRESEPILAELGQATAVGLPAYIGMCALRGARRGTDVIQQFASPINIGVGLAAAIVYAYFHELDMTALHHTSGMVWQLTGAGAAGAAMGSVIRPFYRATLNQAQGFIADFPQNSPRGAAIGAAIGPVLYGIAHGLMKYL
ncbi:hypothetical protein JW968_02555 [Candidatus Woesearchaeota archaeon]|nr:hypothetical protein [Candidatus Woesearchaeota archaeon]